MVELRPWGVGRSFGAGFLTVWLGVWAVGEVVALGALAVGAAALFAPGAVPSAPRLSLGPVVVLGGAFLVVFLTFWSIGGLVAIRELLGLLWGVDRIGVDGADLVLESSAGPLRRTRRWPRDTVRRILVHRGDGSLSVESNAGTTPLTRFGDPALRLALRERLRIALAIDAGAEQEARGTELPEGWEAEVRHDGSEWIVPRRAIRGVQARTAWIVTAALLTALVALATRAPGAWGGLAVVGALVLLAAMVAAWLSFGGTFFRVRSGVLEHGVRFGWREWAWRFDEPELAIERRTDRDGDEHFRLVVRDAAGDYTLLCTMNDSRPPILLGRWLADRIGVPFEETAELQAAG